MNLKRPGRAARRVGAVLLVAGCPEAPCNVPDVNDAGMRCICRDTYVGNDKFEKKPYCDPDIGNPCPIGCFNPKEADGGRQYEDAGVPVCFC